MYETSFIIEFLVIQKIIKVYGSIFFLAEKCKWKINNCFLYINQNIFMVTAVDVKIDDLCFYIDAFDILILYNQSL